MKKIGLTGGIGSGKSSVAKAFESAGIPTLNADQVARDVVEPGTKGNRQVRSEFGDGVFTAEGHMDRAKLRDYMFKHPDALRKLEGIIHPLVVESFNSQTELLKTQGHSLVIIEIPLLIEAKMQNLVDAIIVVDLPEEVQKKRAMQRDQATEESVDRIMKQQVDRITRLREAHYIIDNSTDLASMNAQVLSLLKQLEQ